MLPYGNQMCFSRPSVPRQNTSSCPGPRELAVGAVAVAQRSLSSLGLSPNGLQALLILAGLSWRGIASFPLQGDPQEGAWTEGEPA